MTVLPNLLVINNWELSIAGLGAGVGFGPGPALLPYEDETKAWVPSKKTAKPTINKIVFSTEEKSTISFLKFFWKWAVNKLDQNI